MTFNAVRMVQQIAIYAVPLLLGVISHEVAHGWVAEKLGDPTARWMGRISFNPLVHVDPVGTILLPLILIVTGAPFLFGWAKPVPVNFRRVRGGRRGMAWVAIAGPLTNLMLACVSAVIYRILYSILIHGMVTGSLLKVLQPLFIMARFSVIFNLVLMVVNLIPIPPLDGGRICVGLLPQVVARPLARIERFGMMILLVLIVTNLWSYFIDPVVSVLLRFFLWQ